MDLYVSDVEDCEDAPCETIANDLELFRRLAEVHRTKGIGRLDADLLIEAMRDLLLVGAGHEPGSMHIEVFAMLACRWEQEREAKGRVAQPGSQQ